MTQVAKSIVYDPEKFGAGDYPELGRYHAIIVKSEEPDAKGMCNVDFMILDGTVKGQKGKTITDRYFPYSEKAAVRLQHLWYVTRVATLAQIQNGDDIPMKALEGRQLLIEIVMDKGSVKDGKTYAPKPQVGYRPEAVDHMSHGWEVVPRDAAALRGELNFEDSPMTGGTSAGKDDGGDPFEFK